MEGDIYYPPWERLLGGSSGGLQEDDQSHLGPRVLMAPPSTTGPRPAQCPLPAQSVMPLLLPLTCPHLRLLSTPMLSPCI